MSFIIMLILFKIKGFSSELHTAAHHPPPASIELHTAQLALPALRDLPSQAFWAAPSLTLDSCGWAAQGTE